MRLRFPIVLAVAGSLALAAGCGDDSSDDTQSAGTLSSTSTTGPDTPVSEPDPSDGSGSAPSTSAPSTSAGGGGGGTLPSQPANLVGVVTDSQGGRILVEEQPDAPDRGRKAWVAIEGPVFTRGGGDPTPAEASDVQVGQRVSAWTGICAESYPEQCAAEALVIE